MSMLKHLVHVSFLFVSACAMAQVPSLLLMTNDTAWKSKSMMAFVSGEGGIASNSVDVRFMQKSLLGGHIQRDHIDNLWKNMPENSRVGYAVNAQLELLNFRDTLFGKPNLGLRAALSTHYHGYVAFQPNAFELVYRGNANDDALSTELGPISMQSQAWQKFGFGLFNKKTLSGVTLSLVEGQSYRSLHADQLSLYTSGIGDSLNLQVSGDYFRSDTTRNGWANGSGIGACLDFDYNLLLDNGDGFVGLSVRNLGFVAWNDLSEQYRLNSSLNWEGVDATDWLGGELDSLSLPDWNDSLNTDRVQKTMVKALPATIQLRYLHKWKGNRYWETGVSFKPNAAAVPLVYAGLSHAIGKGLWLSERVSYGGYGGFAIGADVQWLSTNSWFLRAGATQLEGWILPGTGGRSVYFNLGKNF